MTQTKPVFLSFSSLLVSELFSIQYTELCERERKFQLKLKIMWIIAIKYAPLFDAFLVFFLAITPNSLRDIFFFAPLLETCVNLNNVLMTCCVKCFNKSFKDFFSYFLI